MVAAISRAVSARIFGGSMVSLNLAITKLPQNNGWSITGSGTQDLGIDMTVNTPSISALFARCFIVDWAPIVELKLDQPLNLEILA